VQAPLAALDELEVLDGVRDVHVGAREPRLRQGRVEQRARWPDERVTLKILLVAGLLAHEQDARARWTLAEHGLRRVQVERAVLAVTAGGGRLSE
jgi:hypothetical protein